jgi:PAS domain S-box-containing protein
MKIANKITISFFITGLILTGILALLVKAGLPIHMLFVLVPITAGFIGFFIAIVFFRPISRLCKGAEIIRSGDFEYRMGIETHDEIGQLSNIIDLIAGDLKKANETICSLNAQNVEQRKTKRQLQKSKEHFQRLFEYSNDAVFIYDFDGNIIDANNKACQMLSYSKNEFLQKPFYELQTEEELTKAKAAVKTSTKPGSVRFESVFQRKDGSTINVEISSSIVDLKKGVMQSIVSNITERKEIEESLRESEEKFRTFMETAKDLMFITNGDGKFTFVNDSMVRTLGYLREEMVGMPFQEILNKDTLEDVKKIREQCLEAGDDIHKLVWETKNRKNIYGEMKSVAIFDNDGQFHGIRGVFRDMTKSKDIKSFQRLVNMEN